MQLTPGAYAIKIKGVQVGAGELMPGMYLAMDSGGVTSPVEGTPTQEPAFGLPALWISEEQRQEAEIRGYTVVDCPSIIATHLTEVLRSHAPELLGRQNVKELLDEVKKDNAVVVDELVPDLLSIGDIQRVLQNLLGEGVPIRDLVTILESLADHARHSKDPVYLTERVREAIGRHISRLYAGPEGFIPAITLDPAFEEEIAAAIEQNDRGMGISLAPERLEEFYQVLSKSIEAAARAGQQAVVLCSPSIRWAVKRLTSRVLPKLAVISYNELDPSAQVHSYGVVNVTSRAS